MHCSKPCRVCVIFADEGWIPVLYGLYLSATGALAEDAKSAVIANNLANVNTTAFKNDLAVVRARLAEAEEKGFGALTTPLDAVGGGAIVCETRTRFVQGPMTETKRPLDLAIYGDGFFQVTDGSHDYYTRAGSFVRDAAGRIATADGKGFLADRTGRPVTVPVDGDLSISRDGTIGIGDVTVGKIDLVNFSDLKALEKVGANLYANRGASAMTNGVGEIKQGMLEASNVSPVDALSRMIAASRGYEMNMQLIRMQDQTLGELVSIGRITI
jgi:flagellar basal body rod protein FlgG